MLSNIVRAVLRRHFEDIGASTTIDLVADSEYLASMTTHALQPILEAFHLTVGNRGFVPSDHLMLVAYRADSETGSIVRYEVDAVERLGTWHPRRVDSAAPEIERALLDLAAVAGDVRCTRVTFTARRVGLVWHVHWAVTTADPPDGRPLRDVADIRP